MAEFALAAAAAAAAVFAGGLEPGPEFGVGPAAGMAEAHCAYFPRAGLAGCTPSPRDSYGGKTSSESSAAKAHSGWSRERTPSEIGCACYG